MSLLKYLFESIKEEAFESPFDVDVIYDNKDEEMSESDCGCDHRKDIEDEDDL
jgi:hypothetical protein